MTRKATTYNKLVGRIDDEYYFCDDIFDYENGLHGATATVLRPISHAEYEENTSEEGLIEHLGDLWQDAVANDDTELGKVEWCQYVYDVDGDDALFDFSGDNLWDQLREIGISEDEYPVITCTGGGRSFSNDQKFDEIYDQDLLDKIIAAEITRR